VVGHACALRIRLLGRARANWGGRELRFGSRNAWGLLALLALRPRPRPRESIAADLWPDGGPSSTAALRQALWLMRTGFAEVGANPDVLLEVDDDVIGLRPDLPVDLDAVRFEAMALAGPARCEEAASLYGGDLAEGLSQECFARDRERLGDLFEDVLASVAATLLARRDLDAARNAALRLVALDPLREEAHAVLIEVYSWLGTRSQVGRQYRRLRAVLREELGVDPLPETEAVYRAAMDRAWAGSAKRELAAALAAQPALGTAYDVRPAGLVATLGLATEVARLSRS
jgi:DNA-binding SARP family transcriptional activator